MTSRDFAFWLQGFFEIHGKVETMPASQVDIIKQHLAMVFVHEIDPSHGDEKKQETLNHMHGNDKSGVKMRC